MTNMAHKLLSVGDPVPWFSCPSSNNNKFHFETVAGRYLVLSFYGSMNIDKNAKVIEYITRDIRYLFDDQRIVFFGVSVDQRDQKESKVKQMIPGIRYFWDYDLKVSQLFGAYNPKESLLKEQIVYISHTLVLDPFLRVIANIPMKNEQEHNQTLFKVLSELPNINDYAGVPINAPVLIVPRIFEPSFCKELIKLYQDNGGTESGFMREKDGNTVGVLDYKFKRRQDYDLESDDRQNAQLMSLIKQKISLRLIPEIEKAFQFKVTRMERFLVARYDAEIGGFFRPHRDNTTKGTAHRRFACTINLNAEEYQGGNLRFPEFGTTTYRAPTGGAVVFSCSLLHEATPVTQGTRYAFLPFLYDEQSAKIRAENFKFLSREVINKNETVNQLPV